MTAIPKGFQRLEGSERRPSSSATFLGAADPREIFAVTIVLRRRLDGAQMPHHDLFLNTPPSERRRMSTEVFAALYGASDEDIAKVTDFASRHLTVVETNAARRLVVVSGTVAQMEASFSVKLGLFKHQIVPRTGAQPKTETYRGLDGYIHIPENLAEIIIGVFGLDDRTVTMRNSSKDPPNTKHLKVSDITTLYNFPGQHAEGQTIAIFSTAGYNLDDITDYFDGLGIPAPGIKDISIDKDNTPGDSPETTMDICVSSSAAPGASVAVYFTQGKEQGWIDLIERVAIPNHGDPACSVLSSSYYHYETDVVAKKKKKKDHFLISVSEAFHDAALQHVTVCVASGDAGSGPKGDGKAHVEYPASDPWVLSVGGTTVGNVSSDNSSYTEYLWNDDHGATGGGVSEYFPLPFYQSDAGVPTSLTNQYVGRGVPDVAANASPHSCYEIIFNGKSKAGGGTSASAPLWAGLIARINASLGGNVGFINPALYSLGSSFFNDIDGSEGPTDNAYNGAPGYSAQAGWDACTGWGSINGTELLSGLKQVFTERCYIIPFFPVVRMDGTDVTKAFSLRVGGFRPEDFGIQSGPPVTASINPVISITATPPVVGKVSYTLIKIDVQDKTLPPTPQLFTWRCHVTFPASVLFIRLLATLRSSQGDSVIPGAVVTATAVITGA